MLEVPNTPALLPVTGPNPINLDAFVAPTPNLVNGYNIAEQTCFHTTTVSNVIPSLKAISAAYKSLLTLCQDVTQTITAAVGLVADLITAVARSVGLLGAVAALITTVTTLVGTITGLVTAIIGAITGIIGSLAAIRTGAIIAAILAGLAAVSCALFWVPFVGIGFLAGGAIAITVLLTVVFILISIAVGAILGSLGTITASLATLTAALGTVTGPLGTVAGTITPLTGILTNPAAPSDVSRDLTSVQNSLGPVQTELATLIAVLNNVTGTLDQRAIALADFLRATPAGQPVTPRAHLEDTYKQAVQIYDAAVTALQNLTGSTVLAALLSNTTNKPQIDPAPTNAIDMTLACVGVLPQG